MSPTNHPTSGHRKLFHSLRSITCFGSKSQRYSALSSDSLPLLSEKTSFHPSVPHTPANPPSPPPRLTRWPSSHNLKSYHSLQPISKTQEAEQPPADDQILVSTRSRAGRTPETELVDELSLMDRATQVGITIERPVDGQRGMTERDVVEERREVASA